MCAWLQRSSSDNRCSNWQLTHLKSSVVVGGPQHIAFVSFTCKSIYISHSEYKMIGQIVLFLQNFNFRYHETSLCQINDFLKNLNSGQEAFRALSWCQPVASVRGAEHRGGGRPPSSTSCQMWDIRCWWWALPLTMSPGDECLQRKELRNFPISVSSHFSRTETDTGENRGGN